MTRQKGPAISAGPNKKVKTWFSRRCPPDSTVCGLSLALSFTVSVPVVTPVFVGEKVTALLAVQFVRRSHVQAGENQRRNQR